MNRILKIIYLLAPLVFSVSVTAASLTGRVSTVSSSGRGTDRSGVVVWLEAASAAPNAPLQSGAPASQTAIMAQKKQVFQPHVLAVQVGTAVDFPNADRKSVV